MTDQKRAHYSVYSVELDRGCTVFNARSKDEAREEALQQVLGELLDNLYDGDASSSDYDAKSDLEVTLLCDNQTVRALETQDM